MYLAVYITSLCFMNAFGEHAPPITDTTSFLVSQPVSTDSPTLPVPADTSSSSAKEIPHGYPTQKPKINTETKLIPSKLDDALVEDKNLEALVRDVRRTGFGRKLSKRKGQRRTESRENVDAEEGRVRHSHDQASEKKLSNSFENRKSVEPTHQQDSIASKSEDHFFTHAREFKSELDHFLNHKTEPNNPEDVKHLEEHKNQGSNNPGKFEDDHFLEYAREFKSELDRYLNQKKDLNSKSVSQTELQSKSLSKLESNHFNNTHQVNTALSSAIFQDAEEGVVSPQDFKAEVERYFENARGSPQYERAEAQTTGSRQVTEKETIPENNREVSSKDIQFNGNSQDFKSDVEKYFEKARLSAQYESEKPKLSANKQVSSSDERSSVSITRSEKQDFNSNVGRKEQVKSNKSIKFDIFQPSIRQENSFEQNGFGSIPDGSGLRLTHIPVPKSIVKNIKKSDEGFNKAESIAINRRNDFGITGPYPPHSDVDYFVHKESRPYPGSKTEGFSFEQFDGSKPYPGSKSEGHSFDHLEVSRPYPQSKSQEGHSFEHFEELKPYPGLKSEEGHSVEQFGRPTPYPNPKSEEGQSFKHFDGSRPYPGSKSEEGHSVEQFGRPTPYPNPKSEEGQSFKHFDGSRPYPGSKSENVQIIEDFEAIRPYHKSRKDERGSVRHLGSKSEGHFEGLRPDSKSKLEKEQSLKNLEGSKPYPVSRTGRRGSVRYQGLKSEDGKSFEHSERPRTYPGSRQEEHGSVRYPETKLEGPIGESSPYPGSKSENSHSFRHSEETRPYPELSLKGHSFVHIEGSRLYPVANSKEGHSFVHIEGPKPYADSKTDEGRTDIPRPYPGSKSLKELSFEHTEEQKPYPESILDREHSFGSKPHPESILDREHSFGSKSNPESKTEIESFVNSKGSRPYPDQTHKNPKLVKVFAPYPLSKSTLQSTNQGLGSSLEISHISQANSFENFDQSGKNVEAVKIPLPYPPLKLENGQKSTQEFPPYSPLKFVQPSNPSDSESHSNVQEFSNEELSTKTSLNSEQVSINSVPETKQELVSLEHSLSPYPRPYPPSGVNTLPHDQPSEVQFFEEKHQPQQLDTPNSVNLNHVPIEIHSKGSHFQPSSETINNFNLGKQSSINSVSSSLTQSTPSNADLSFVPDSFKTSQPLEQTFKQEQKQSAIYIPIPKSELENILQNNQGAQKSVNSLSSENGLKKDHVFNTLALINPNKQASDNDFKPTLPHKFTYVKHLSALSPENSAVLPPESSSDSDFIPILPFRLHNLSKQFSQTGKESTKGSSDDFKQSHDTVTEFGSETFPKNSLKESLNFSEIASKSTDVNDKPISSFNNGPAAEYGLPELRR